MFGDGKGVGGFNTQQFKGLLTTIKIKYTYQTNETCMYRDDFCNG